MGIIKAFQNKISEEKGAVQIVEAAFVFPIMFIVIFFLIYMGDAFYIKTRIESIVASKAIEGANYCTDPILETIKATGNIPDLNQLDIKPYRYIFGGMNGIEKEIGKEVKEAIEGSSKSFFKNMKPQVKTSQSEIARYNNYLIYSTFSVEVDVSMSFPIRMLGQATPNIMRVKSRTEVAVNDVTEFIRNTDLVIDYFEDSKLGQTIKGVFDKINKFIENFASK